MIDIKTATVENQKIEIYIIMDTKATTIKGVQKVK